MKIHTMRTFEYLSEYAGLWV